MFDSLICSFLILFIFCRQEAFFRGYPQIQGTCQYWTFLEEVDQLWFHRVKIMIKLIFFTPILCVYTSSPLDGMAKNYYYSYLHGYARSRNLSGLDSFYSYLLIREERRETFGLSWNQTHVLLLHKRPIWPLYHGSSGNDEAYNQKSCTARLF